MQGEFDVITHGCNCFCTMGAGIAPQMAEAFGCDKFALELTEIEEYDPENEEYYKIPTNHKGDINKLGQIDYQKKYLWFKHPAAKDGLAVPMNHKTVGQEDVKDLYVVNSYTQYHYGANHRDGVAKPLDYEALTLCMRKINRAFSGMKIGLPQIGCGLAGGDWNVVKEIIRTELTSCDVTVVIFKRN